MPFISNIGRLTLLPKVERPSSFTNQIARNQEFGLSILYTRGQSPHVVALQNAYMVVLFDSNFDQSDQLSKEVWIKQEWSKGRRFFS